MVNAEGLELEALENFAPAHWYDVLTQGDVGDRPMSKTFDFSRLLSASALR